MNMTQIPRIGTMDPKYIQQSYLGTDYCLRRVTARLVCTYEEGHRGLCVAHGPGGKVLAVLHLELILPEGL